MINYSEVKYENCKKESLQFIEIFANLHVKIYIY